MVGGGDGGVLREIGKHPMVEEMHICELDEVYSPADVTCNVLVVLP